MNLLIKSVNDGLLIGVVFIDFCKAFDLVDHHFLMYKSALKWFQSYVNNWTLKVKFKDATTKALIMDKGVSQGLILGALFFIIFINDISLRIKTCNIDMYADDYTLTATGKSVVELVTKITKDLTQLSE